MQPNIRVDVQSQVLFNLGYYRQYFKSESSWPISLHLFVVTRGLTCAVLKSKELVLLFPQSFLSNEHTYNQPATPIHTQQCQCCAANISWISCSAGMEPCTCQASSLTLSYIHPSSQNQHPEASLFHALRCRQRPTLFL